MRRLRFSISGLLAFITVCGVAIASLKESSDLWENGVFNLTLVVFLTSVLLAIHRTGARRNFWVGFALFGSCYLGLSLIPAVEARLISSKGLAFLHPKLPGQPPEKVIGAIFGVGSAGQQNQAVEFSVDGRNIAAGREGFVGLWDAATGKLIGAWGSSIENFVKIGHSWLALLAGWIGGSISRRLSRSSPPSDTIESLDAQSKTERARPPVS